jgi:hypothetical protein
VSALAVGFAAVNMKILDLLRLFATGSWHWFIWVGLDEAKVATAEYLKFDPAFTISTRIPNYREMAFRQKYHGALRTVGLPE